jgi:RimJ/RimL family protein N-acetyltransferase
VGTHTIGRIYLSLQIVDAKEHPPKEEEIWALAEIEMHPKVIEWNTSTQIYDPNKMRHLFKTFFEKLPDDENQIFLVGKFKGRVIGFVGVHRKSKTMKHIGVVGITVHPDYWSKGFGTELLKAGVEYARNAGFLRLEANALAKNKAIIRVAEKVGFKLEDIRKGKIRMGRKYADEVLLGIAIGVDG